MKKSLLLLLFVSFAAFSQEKVTETVLKDGWYETENVTMNKKNIYDNDESQWVYVESGVIKSIGHQNKIKNKINSLEENFHKSNVNVPDADRVNRVSNYTDFSYKRNFKKYLRGGVLSIEKHNDKLFYVTEILFETGSAVGKTRVYYYSIKV